MHLTWSPFWWPRRCAGTVPSTSTETPCSALQLKPLDTAIGWIFAPYCPGDRQGPIQASKITQSNDKTNTKTYILHTIAQTKKEKHGGNGGYLQILQKVQTQKATPSTHLGRQMHVAQKGSVFPIQECMQEDEIRIRKERKVLKGKGRQMAKA